MKKVLLFLCLGIFSLNRLYAQATCTAVTYNVDLSASIDTSVIIQSTRSGDCCGGTNCIRFNVTMNPACSYVNFTVENPAPPGNAAYYQVNCGPQTSLGTPICVVGQSFITITFCKPGNDNPIYTITAAGALQGSPDITVREGCTGSLSVNGLTASTINWTSIYPGVQGAYNSFLSCTAGCTSTTVTPQQGAPAYIDYMVSGNRMCGPVVSDTIRVYTTPQIATAITPDNITICAGDFTTLTATASGGDAPYNFLWSNGQSGQTISVNSGGTYSVAVTDIHNCLPAISTATVIVAPVPTAPSVTSNSPVCAGTTLNLFASTVPGAAYSWTGPNGFTSSQQNPVINNVTAANAGSYSVVVTVGQCTSVAASTSVVINAIPASPLISTNSPLCAGMNLNLNASLISGAAYSWAGPNGFSSSNQNPVINNAGMINAGIYSVTATVNGCTSISSSATVIVHPLPAVPVVSGNSLVCAGSSINLSAGTINGASYSWTGPNGFTSSLQNPSITNAGINNSGVYSVTATVNGCSGAAGTIQVTVNPIPSSPVVSSNSPLCAGSTLNLSASTIAGASYSWTGPNSFNSSNQNPVINNAGVINAGIYTVTATANGCTSIPSSATVIVNPLPSAPVVSGNNPVCAGSSINLSAGTINGASYSWTGPNGFISSLQNPSIVNAGINNSGVYSVAATVNGCTGSVSTIQITVNPIPSSPSVTSNSPLCAGSTLNLSASAIAGASYSWTGPNSFSSSNQNPVINNAGLINAGIYTVTATVNGCTSIPSSATVLVHALPAAPVVSGNNPVCVGSSLNLSAGSIAGASYSWTGPNSFTSASQNPIIPNAGVNNSGVYSVTATVNGCTGASGTLQVTVKPIPSSPVVTSNSPLCTGSTLNLSASAVAGASYSWTGPNGFNSSTQNNSLTGTINTNSGLYSVIATVNGCASSPVSTMVVIDKPAIVNSGNNQTICSLNKFVNLNGNVSNAGNSGIWSSNGSGSFSPANSNLNASYYPSATDISAGSVRLTLTSTNNGACAASSSSTVISFSPAPSVNAGSNQVVCANNATIQLNGQSNNTQQIVWTTTGNGTFSPSANNLNALYVPGDRDKTNGIVNLVLKSAGNNPCPVAYDTVTLTIKPAPSINSGGIKYVIEKNSTILSPIITGSNLKYSWEPGIYLNNDTISNPVCTPAEDINYQLSVINTFGCASSAPISVKVLKLPLIPNVFSPNGDGINERWEIKYLKDYPDCTVEIFNRYGQLLYKSVGYISEWDGTLKGKPLPAGTYYYIINLKIAAQPLSGFVDIVR
jgi:gliding motility-associated-like protein